MKRFIKSLVRPWAKPLLKNFVYTVAPPSLIAGMKRRGGVYFLPGGSLSPEHRFLKSLDLNQKTVYDIGGYVGLMSMFFSREVGDSGHVITFEPNPENVRAILDHIRLNRLSNVQLVQIGLSDEPEVLSLIATRPAWGTLDQHRQHKLLQRSNGKVFEVQVDTLDNQIACLKLPPPDFVKIDVEGFELKVLKGMHATIDCYHPEMLIELHGVHETEIVELLLEYNYRVYQVEDSVEITRQNIDQKYGHLFVHT